MIIETTVKKGKTLYFDDEKHKFWFSAKDGSYDYVDSVSSFVSIVDKSSPLMGWATNLARDYLLEKLNRGEPIIEVDVLDAAKQYRQEKEKAADRGTKIHELVSLWIKGQQFEIPDDDKIRNGFNAFLQYQEANQVKFLESEKIVYSTKYNYAGITDAIGMVGKDRVLFDFKSSNAIYPEHAIQSAGYQMAFEEQFKKKIAYREIIRFGKDDGNFEAVKFLDNKKDKDAFIACMILKNRIKEMKV